ncbi:hypothetical protein Dret_2336 [Desulfohalobium retbaense DSM 5692]|uniref:Uncharacterized protein n=1 Tax=Desulfohalobium retbaense (strain ATCC 49708 / DSM 5692 / JCM 16813 / HR100) TaxID=485915 RepID=C8X5C2_DESRD|nr:hypothetical protein Dret_2336 [Desulfohalobium retbaense DSM 5692]
MVGMMALKPCSPKVLSVCESLCQGEGSKGQCCSSRMVPLSAQISVISGQGSYRFRQEPEPLIVNGNERGPLTGQGFLPGRTKGFCLTSRIFA